MWFDILKGKNFTGEWENLGKRWEGKSLVLSGLGIILQHWWFSGGLLDFYLLFLYFPYFLLLYTGLSLDRFQSQVTSMKN